MPVPGKSEAPEKVIKHLLCILRDMKSLNTEVKGMITKREFNKYALGGYGMQAGSMEAELVYVT